MNTQQARTLVTETFPQPFDKGRFRLFAVNLLNRIDETKAQAWNTTYIKDAFKGHVSRFERLGTYTSPDDEKLDVLVVHLTNESKLERARTAIRNFVADHLKTRDGKDAALVAFVSPTEKQWRFSYVKMEYAAVEKEDGKIGVQTKLTPARRSSYIVGEGESCHTAQSRFLDLLQDTDNHPTLSQIEDAFSVEAVTKEFFEQYKALFLDLNDEIEGLVKKDKTISAEFAAKKVSTSDFAKKLMGQIVFLYFLQKKGWLGVPKGGNWGDGPHNFLRQLFNGKFGAHKNFFNDILEPLFYDTLATDRGHDAWCKIFNCRIPFLNGGLFEPLAGYDWKKTDIVIPNTLFSNATTTKAGDTGTGILDVFDRYNFTVNEAEPLEKEVAIDPEMLGKVFENLLEVKERKSKGSFYTPREIVHYMCQESLINYLDTALNTGEKSLTPVKPKQTKLFGETEPEQTGFKTTVRRELVSHTDIETFIHSGDQASYYEAARVEGTGYKRNLPKTIEKHARLLDDKLADIAVCDPAIGSGAFPVGMMQEIVRARSALTPYFNDVCDRTPYHFKRHAIQNCIYGVDIDPGAVEIAKLRLWLSLVVDEDDVKQIKPLPNLDYKIVVGNSLLGVEKNLFNQDLFKRLEELKPKYFDATDRKQKEKFKHEIDGLINELTNGKEAFDFEIYFSEVMDKKRRGGFDVVIANPPYISAVEFAKRYSESYRKKLNERFKTAKGTYDIYVLFIEEGIRLLTGRGVLTFINPNKFLSANYAVALREHILANASLLKLIDVSGILVFEQAAVYPVVSVMQKLVNASDKVHLALPLVRETQEFDINNFTALSVAPEFLRCLPENIWGFLLSTKIDLLLKLIEGTQRLSEVAAINASSTAAEADAYGAHIQNREAKKSLKLVNTGTIERFFTLWGLEELTHAGEKFMTPYLPLDRAGVSDRRRQLYSAPKLIYAKMAKNCEAFFDREGEFASLNTNCLFEPKNGVSLGFIAGYCNSKLFMFFYDQFFGALRMSGGYYQFQAPQLRVMPFRKPDSAMDKTVCRLVDRILSAKQRDAEADTSALEREIDELAYALYGLTPGEIKIVEGR
jgi:type I restriction-modification system DNA methylase subunit